MKKLLLLLGFFIILFFNSCSDVEMQDDVEEEIIIPQGTVLTTEFIQSEILSREMHYSIYLPSGYDESSEDYPVLYLLHGMWGNYKDWITNGMANITDIKISKDEAVKMIIVMPDGLDAFYCNNYNGGDLRYEDFMIEEFIPQIEATYQIKTEENNRAIAGLSMGGYGATFHAFKRPDMFCCCYAMSGAFEVNGTPDLKSLCNDYSEEERKNLPPFTMECGTEDMLVYSSNESFEQFLTSLNIEHEYVKRSGTHDWTFWMTSLPKVLVKVSESFAQN